MYLKSTKSCSQSYSNAKHDIYMYIFQTYVKRSTCFVHVWRISEGPKRGKLLDNTNHYKNISYEHNKHNQ
jgi:hypothetical protein